MSLRDHDWHGLCDVRGCFLPAVHVDVGEAGDLWLCAEHDRIKTRECGWCDLGIVGAPCTCEDEGPNTHDGVTFV